MQKITENIYYVGVNDRNKSLFEGLWPLPNGVSYNSYPGPKAQIMPDYYRNIRNNPLACLIKCIDRVNNLSGMSYGFTRHRMIEYVVQTEKDILPLLEVIKDVPEWNQAAWLLRYQMVSLLETFKRILYGR